MTRHPTCGQGGWHASAFPRLILSLALLFGCVHLISAAYAADVLTLYAGTEHYPLGRHLAYLEDKTGTLTLDELIQVKAGKSFAPSLSETPNFGFSKSAYWLRLDLVNLDTKY